MGTRLIEDFLAKSGWTRCTDFKETAQVVSAVAFKMFLNCCPKVAEISGNEFGLIFTGDSAENSLPIYEFVSLPEDLIKEGLIYGNILPGLIKGSLEMVNNQQKNTKEIQNHIYMPILISKPLTLPFFLSFFLLDSIGL